MTLKPNRNFGKFAFWLFIGFFLLNLIPVVSSGAGLQYIDINRTYAHTYADTYSQICPSGSLKINTMINYPLPTKPGATSSIAFIVTDDMFNPVPSAVVTVSSPGGALTPLSGTTNPSGKFLTSFSSPKVGLFFVNASVSKTDYCGGSTSTSIEVHGTPPEAKISVITPLSPSGPPPLTVQFDGSGSKATETGATITSWSWYFGDGLNGTGKTTSHTYSKNGTFSIYLTVTDNYGSKGVNPWLSNIYIVTAPTPAPAVSTTTPIPVVNTTTRVPVVNTMIVPVVNTTKPVINVSGEGNVTPPPLPEILVTLIAMVILLILIVAIVLAYLWTRSKLQLNAKQKDVPCDEKSTVAVRAQFVNGFGSLKKQHSDREIHMETTAGKIQDVILPAGKEYVDATLTSSKECGTVTITGTSDDKDKATTQVQFVGEATSIDVDISPTEIPADGNSTATIILKIKDRNGVYLSYLDEKIINLTTTLGTVPAFVKIEPKGMSGTATIVSGDKKGTALIKARTGEIVGEGKIQFKELGKRYCMHCGVPMEMEAPSCPKCGKIAPSGVDTKQCSTCNTVLPLSAKFCDKCGARQPV